MVLCRVALTAEEVAAAVGQQAMVFHRVWVATTLTDSAEAAGGSRSWRLEKKGQRTAKTAPADSPRACRASLDTLSGLHNHEP
jgi:hypothetical protein